MPLYVSDYLRWNKKFITIRDILLNTHAVANLIRTRKEPQIISIQENTITYENTRNGCARCEGTIWLSTTTTYAIRSTIIVGEYMEAYEYVVKKMRIMKQKKG